MGEYRSTRNTEASVIDYITDILSDAWSSVVVEKIYDRVYNTNPPMVVVRPNTTTYTEAGLGSTSSYQNIQVIIDIYATSDGQRLDLKDYIILKLKPGMPYYEYYTEKDSASGDKVIIKKKDQTGRLSVRNIQDTPVDLGVERQTLKVQDRFRHRITITVTTSKIEV